MNREDRRTRALVYARFSDPGKTDSESVDTQLARGKEYCDRNGYELLGTYADRGKSAFKDDVVREDFDRMLDDVPRLRPDVVVVRAFNRLMRDEGLSLWRMTQAAKRHPYVVEYYAGGQWNPLTDGLMGFVNAGAAYEESKRRSDAVKEAVNRNRRDGKRLGGGPRPFGWVRIYAEQSESDPRRRHILREELHPDEARLIREAAERITSDGKVSLRRIAAEWEAAGVKRPSGGRWHGALVGRILRSARVAGLVEIRDPDTGEVTEVVKAVDWPAIIDTTTRERVLAVLKGNVPRGGGARRHLLPGFLRCGGCGESLWTMVPQEREGTRVDVKRRGRSYGCKTPECPSKARVVAEPLEEFVTRMVMARLDSPALRRALPSNAERDERHAQLLDTLKALEIRLREARTDYANLAIDRNDWFDIRDAVTAQLKERRRELDRLTESQVFAEIPPEQVAREAWADWDNDQRRALLGALVDHVTIGPFPKGLSRRPYADPAREEERIGEIMRARVSITWRF